MDRAGIRGARGDALASASNTCFDRRRLLGHVVRRPLDLLADPDILGTKVKARLLKLNQERERITEQLSGVELDLSEGALFLEASLALLENPYELYQHASDEVRRRLNQAIFSNVYITDEQVTGYRLNEPLGHLFATEAAHAAASAGLDDEAIQAAFHRAFATNTATKQKTAPKGGLLNSSATTAWAYLFTGPVLDGVSNKPSMVEMGGIE